VPFLIYIPDGLKKYFSTDELNNLEENSKLFISNNDIFPTVLDSFNLPAPAGLVGQSLLKPYRERMNFIIFDYENSFAAIHSHSGEKFYVDNTKKQVRITNIQRDPLEQSPEYVKIDKSYLVDDVLQMYQQRAVTSRQSTQIIETARD
jgi:arylsulfatase A-like enzyme